MKIDWNSINELLAGLESHFADEIVLIDALNPTYSFTGRTLSQLVWRCRTHLERSGVNSESWVVLMQPNSVEWEVHHLALLSLGATFVALDSRESSSRTLQILSDLPITHEIGQAALKAGAKPIELMNLEGLDESVRTEWRSLPQSEPKIVAFSSGTNSTPKAVIYSHNQLALAVGAISNHLGKISNEDRTFCLMPVANLFQRMINLVAFSHGVPVWIVSNPRAALSALSIAKPTILVGVPYFFNEIGKEMARALNALPWPVRIACKGLMWFRSHSFNKSVSQGPIDVENTTWGYFPVWPFKSPLNKILGGSIRYLVSGSAPASIDLIADFATLGLPILEAYGLSECLIPMAMNQPKRWRPGTVGTPLTENQLKFSDDGEIWVKSEALGRPWHGARVEWHHTGDLGSIDPQGFLQLKGRQTDMFKLANGRRVYALEVEERIKRIDGVDEVLVVGSGREKVAAILFVSVKLGRELVDRPQVVFNKIRAVCADLPEFLIPSRLILSTQAPSIALGEMTSGMKMKRQVIVEHFDSSLDKIYLMEGSKCLMLAERS